jgi:hypothetical protein
MEMAQLNTDTSLSASMRASLHAFYMDLLEFFGAIAKVFTQPDGSMSKILMPMGYSLTGAQN